MRAHPPEVLNGKRRRDGSEFTDGQIDGRQLVARSQVCQQLRVRVDWRAHRVVLEWHLRNESLTKQPVAEHGQPTEAPLTVRDEYACPVTELGW